MQLLFSLNRDKELTYSEVDRRYWKAIDKTFELYLFSLFLIINVTKESLSDAEKRKKKHLPSEEDKAFIPKLYENEIISCLTENKALNLKFDKLNFEAHKNEDYFKKTYSEFAKTEEYKAYILDKASEPKSHLDIILELFRFCRKDELFLELLENGYSNWIDDKSVVVGAIKKTVKNMPSTAKMFFNDHYPDDETIKEFGEELMKLTFNQDEELLEMIKPHLDNWEHDRVAIIDMILLKMAIVELLNFESIPTKVTINEYVEVSKNYSTPKSKEFINGVLDSVLTLLVKDDKIKKSGRGLVE